MPHRPDINRVIAPWRGLLRLAEAELLPRRCPFCGVPLQRGGYPVCPGCRADLPRNGPACRTCAMPLPAEIEAVCAACQAQPPPFLRVVAPCTYDYPLDAAIRAMKFRRRLYYLPAFARLMLEAVPRLPADLDALLPVPLHRLRLVCRGFNQALELAKPIAQATGLPLLRGVRRSRHTPYQSGLAPAARRRNLAGAFRAGHRIDATHVLIVDDVVTTGATCRQLAALLRARGVERVSVLALARALGD